MEQTAIPVPDPPPPAQVCAWCGAEATEELVVEKARWRNDRGTRVIAKAAVTRPVCAHHYKTIKRTGLDDGV